MRAEATRASRWQDVAQLVLAAGLAWAAGQSLSTGGALNLALGGAQVATAILVLVLRQRVVALGLATLVLFPQAVTALRNWTAHLPGACKCAASAHAAPGLFSLTGAGFVAHVALIALAVSLARRKDVTES